MEAAPPSWRAKAPPSRIAASSRRKLLPTPAIKDQHQLGFFSKKNLQKGALVCQEVWDGGYVNNWRQGSGILVTGPRRSARTQLLGNQIENAAQGIDLHCAQVIVANNIVNNAFIGLKAMHGSRNVLIIGNQFIKNDLWAIGLMPGAASGRAHAAEANTPALEPNTDGGSLIANNIISDFGFGNAAWIWETTASRNPLRFDRGQTPDNPPLTDVLVQGNIVYDTGRDQPLIAGVPSAHRPATNMPCGSKPAAPIPPPACTSAATFSPPAPRASATSRFRREGHGPDIQQKTTGPAAIRLPAVSAPNRTGNRPTTGAPKPRAISRRRRAETQLDA